jgi:hypothetical protein
MAAVTLLQAANCPMPKVKQGKKKSVKIPSTKKSK